VTASVVLVTGDELMAEAALLEERTKAVGDLDPSWVLSELEPGPSFIEQLAATATLGLGDERRVVMVRRAGALDPGGWDALLAYVGDLPDHVSLVIEGQSWGGPARARALSDRVKKAGGTVRREDLPPPGKRADMVREHAARRGLRLDARASRYLAEYLGDELGNLGTCLDQLLSRHGADARLGEDEVAALFQGSRHGFQWDITDAIDRGDAPAALAYVHGALDTWHPLQLHAALVTHYRRILALAGRNVTPAQAAEELKMKEYPARKTAQQAQRLGVEGAVRAYELLGESDVALRGAAGALGDGGVIDVLIVQLCALTHPGSGSASI